MKQKVNHHSMHYDTPLYRQADLAVLSIPPENSFFKRLTFPLNVYAYAQLLQEGKTTYLHYGLFQNSETNLQTAQQFSTDLAISRLPQPPCRILEVGVGLGTTFSLLTQKGYIVHGITPDEQQIAYIKECLGGGISVSRQSLEDFSGHSDNFDAILFQESAQYIDPLVIFDKALDLLPSGGDLIIMDEFALKSDETGLDKLHLLKNTLALAERFGFELIEHSDLSALAAPTLDYLLRITTEHRQHLIRDLALSDEQLTQLDESNRCYRNNYTSGHYGYALLHFKKKTNPKWRLGLLTEKQTPAMLDLFQKTFGHAMPLNLWQWKYGLNSGREIGIWREQQLISHYGGIQRNILFFGTSQTAVQIGDVMVSTSERGSLTKKGPFFLMAATFLERYIGYGKPYLIGFGFPNERAMKVAERHGLYTEVGRLVEFSWNTLSRLPQWGTRLYLIERESPDSAAAVDECWQRMAVDLQQSIIGVRDWQYLCHRYLNHPNQAYQIVLVKNRFRGQARGILVLRYDSDECEIVDLIAPLTEISLLTIHARRLAGMRGASRVFCQITENFASYFCSTGGEQRPSDIRIPANAWSEGPAPAMLKNYWWLMSGDKDFR